MRRWCPECAGYTEQEMVPGRVKKEDVTACGRCNHRTPLREKLLSVERDETGHLQVKALRAPSYAALLRRPS